MSPVIGRFAPTPSGPLHLGSLVGALGSYLSVKSRQGLWRLRIDDLDAPRVAPGSVDSIFRTLEAFGLHWDGPVIFQSQRLEAYKAALTSLADCPGTYHCTCSRKKIALLARTGPDGLIYPNSCRHKQMQQGTSVRLKTNNQPVCWQDLLDGDQSLNLAAEVGDFVVWRVGGIPSYHLACVVDEELDSVTEVVRGRDLLRSTFRQVYLQKQLGLHRPQYLHLPLVVNPQGRKLSKQTFATPLPLDGVSQSLTLGLKVLGLFVPADLAGVSPATLLDWASSQWTLGSVPHQDLSISG